MPSAKLTVFNTTWEMADSKSPAEQSALGSTKLPTADPGVINSKPACSGFEPYLTIKRLGNTLLLKFRSESSGMRAFGLSPVIEAGKYTAFDLSPSSSTIDEMFSIPVCSRMALASGGILGWPLAIAKDTALIMTVDIPSAVSGVERNSKYDRIVSSAPVNARLVARVEYVFLNGMLFHF
jgi:hypothetical protein